MSMMSIDIEPRDRAAARRRASARHVKIMGSGVATPGRVLTHEELDANLGLARGSSLKVTGIRARHVCTTETASGLAASACHRALRASGLAWEDVDCLVAASATMDQALPYNAAMIHAALGIAGRRTTFDIGASCMSFLTGWTWRAHLIAGGAISKCDAGVGGYRDVQHRFSQFEGEWNFRGWGGGLRPGAGAGIGCVGDSRIGEHHALGGGRVLPDSARAGRGITAGRRDRTGMRCLK